MYLQIHHFSHCMLLAVLLGLAVDVTSGQSSIQLIPQYPVINGSVTLRVTGITGEIVSFSWYKGPNTSAHYQILTIVPVGGNPPVTGPQYNPRITGLRNASLQIRDLHITDGGNYIVKIQTVTAAQDIQLTLTVYEPVTKPKIIASTSQSKENDTFALTCDTSKATTITWTRRGARISSEAKLSGDNRTLTFSSVQRGDSGEYWCEAQNLVSKESSDPFRVSVAYGPDKARIEGALLVSRGFPITLTCSADSAPDLLEYLWRFNGKVLEQKISKYVISNATDEDQGLYMCEVKNPVTQRTATASVYVNVTADAIIFGKDGSIGFVLGLTSAIILGIVLIIVGSFCLYRKFASRRLNEPLENRQKDIVVYENIMAPQVKEESSYMDLQFRSEDTYTDLRR